MPNPVEVVAAVIHDADRVLACRRQADRSAGGKWEFPGGKVEPHESPERALAREIAEELGVEVSVGVLINRSQTQVGENIIDLACYSASIVGSPPTQSTDHDELRWVYADALLALDWAEPDLPTVHALMTE